MVIEIASKPWPKLPYEHPDVKIYQRLFKENIIRRLVRKSAYHRHDNAIADFFKDETHSLFSLCERLTQYITEAFHHYQVWGYSHAYYPGSPGQQTVRTDALEGVSRVLPLLAAWTVNSKKSTLLGLNQQIYHLPSMIKQSFIHGTDPLHKGYWGKLENYDQRICEASDLALTLWISREWVWDTLSSEIKQQIINWFEQVNHCEIVDNNWHFFPLTVQFVIKALTGKDTIAHWRYERLKEFYVGDGWFRDGAKGNYDYYNAWGFYYSLYWLAQIDPQFDHDFITQSLNNFNQHYLYFITPKGIPFFGRSACYRLAVSAPLLAGVDLQCPFVKVGEAKRAFESSLRYFISQGALKNGAPTQGLFNHDARLVDNYSGPASSFWSLRAVIIALYCADRINLWQAPSLPLPIEKNDFRFEIPAIQASIIGVKATQEVSVIFREDYTQQQSPLTRRLEKQTRVQKITETVIGQSRRPKNNLLRKGVTSYSSKMTHFF
ncbi:DUF2264 domain-containing protein [Proteus mirabilis]|uniref:DUF2264 domain-containing protein n=1 Tax=Proteus mirabilis TaxID=584 RepID=UPI002025ABBC|nr:DUF2264 domain-containing protein [Proteus mirabilis]ELA7773378.1 DUF2264 domain-containing protein [Proteus mirabilis]MCL8579822.1 DUF2264 domain-containing protein [Proteus mirabilis]MCL8590662.1 DUF2264 domain-containing protein [Proteus mirabilis]MCL8604801.1 DUF2264 domain-containing protein [Proteus mirabilis]